LSNIVRHCLKKTKTKTEKEEVLLHATTWMNLENMMLSKRSQAQRVKQCGRGGEDLVLLLIGFILGANMVKIF
jgi:hypothetical protein